MSVFIVFINIWFCPLRLSCIACGQLALITNETIGCCWFVLSSLCCVSFFATGVSMFLYHRILQIIMNRRLKKAQEAKANQVVRIGPPGKGTEEDGEHGNN